MTDAGDVRAFFDEREDINDVDGIIESYQGMSDKENAIPVSASTVRCLYDNAVIDLEMGNRLLTNWRHNPEFLGFEVEDKENDTTSYEYMKASKRGNDVHKWRVRKRFKPILDLCDENEELAVVRECPSGHRTQILKFTLTADPKKYDRDEFNEDVVSDELDRWMNKFIRRYVDEDAEYIRSYEVHRGKNKGYIHVNVTVIFPNRSFKMAWWEPKDEDKHSRWILQDKALRNKFTKYDGDKFNGWRCGNADVRGLSDAHAVGEYSVKYFIKDFTGDAHREMQNLTNSVLTLHNKRSFAISGSFEWELGRLYRRCGGSYRLDTSMQNSPQEAGSNSGREQLIFTFLGVYRAAEVDVSSDVWSFSEEHPPPDIAKEQSKQPFVELKRYDVRLLGSEK